MTLTVLVTLLYGSLDIIPFWHFACLSGHSPSSLFLASLWPLFADTTGCLPNSFLSLLLSDETLILFRYPPSSKSPCISQESSPIRWDKSWSVQTASFQSMIPDQQHQPHLGTCQKFEFSNIWWFSLRHVIFFFNYLLFKFKSIERPSHWVERLSGEIDATCQEPTMFRVLCWTLEMHGLI